jgi:hypothetical protein
VTSFPKGHTDIFSRISIVGNPVKVAADDLRTGIDRKTPFPQSYVDFISYFGLGLLCDSFWIYPPLGNYPDSFHQQSPGIKAAFLETLRLDDPAYAFQLQPDGEPALVERLVGFSTSENGHSLFWDVTPGAIEYPIYLTGSGIGLRYVGEDLRQFIANVTDPKTIKSIMKFASNPLPMTFKASHGVQLDKWRQDQKR